MVFGLQSIVLLVLGLLALGLEVFALVDAVRQRKDAFPAAGKLTKPIWLAILGVATAVGFVTFRDPLFTGGIFSLLAVVAAGVYLADVRPAVRNMSGGGPYGRW